MTREQAKVYIKTHPEEYLERDRKGTGYICPICGSGSGSKGTGITTKDGEHFTCWAGCFTHADLIEIIGVERGIAEYNERLTAAGAAFGIKIDWPVSIDPQEGLKGLLPESGRSGAPPRTPPASERRADRQSPKTEEPEQEQDLTEYFARAAADIERTDYHRGISLPTLRRFQVGYVEEWRHPKAPKMKASPRLIIPTSQHSYLARYAGQGDYINFRGDVENKSKVGKARIFNPQAIQQTAQPVFIVEGEIDAMSIIDVGGEALGMGSKGNVRQLTALLEEYRPSQPLIIALDNEKEQAKQEGVEQSVQKIIAELERLGIPYYRENIYAQHKDANEALNADREAFRTAVHRAIEQVEDGEAEKLEAEREQLKRETAAAALSSFMANIEASKGAECTPTGFSELDKLLDGGLYTGLYFVGAVSSLGKTTFCLQIADNIAKAGRDVLIFSLEMARDELIAKSLGRLTYEIDLQRNGSTHNAKSTRSILSGTLQEAFCQSEQDVFNAALQTYAQYATHIYFTVGVGDVGVAEVRERVQRHIRVTGKAPVVIIDYLQILAPADPRATDKQNTDKAVLELKRLSRDYSIPVIGISSFNRDNYTAPVNLASFKESGAIEYSSDVLIGLQYDGMDYQQGEADKAREKRIREMLDGCIAEGKAGRSQAIQLKVLKNRNGSKGSVALDFFPMFNYFTSAAQPEQSEQWEVIASR